MILPWREQSLNNFIPKSFYLASTATTLKVEQSVLPPLIKDHLHLESDLWQNKEPHFSQIYTPHSLSGRKLCLSEKASVSRVCFFISAGFFFNLLASFPSQGGSRGWPLSLSNSQKASVCSSTVYPQEEGYFAICMASTLYLNPKSNIYCMRLFFFPLDFLGSLANSTVSHQCLLVRS